MHERDARIHQGARIQNHGHGQRHGVETIVVRRVEREDDADQKGGEETGHNDAPSEP
jgi:hypothetical protein